MVENTSARDLKILITLQRDEARQPAPAARRSRVQAAIATGAEFSIAIHDLGDIGNNLESGWKDLEHIGHLEPPVSSELEHVWHEFLDGVEDLGGFIREHEIDRIAERMLSEAGKDALQELIGGIGTGNPEAILTAEVTFLFEVVVIGAEEWHDLYASFTDNEDKPTKPPDEEKPPPPGGGGQQTEEEESTDADAGSYGGGGSASGGPGGPEPPEPPEPPEDFHFDEADGLDDDFDDDHDMGLDEMRMLEETVRKFRKQVEEMEAELVAMGATPEQLKAWQEMMNKATGMQEMADGIPREAFADFS